MFRFDKPSISYITGLVENVLPARVTNSGRRLQPIHQVLIALQFYATGAFQSAVGNILRVSQPSVSRALHSVLNALYSIAREHIKFPDNLLTFILLMTSF